MIDRVCKPEVFVVLWIEEYFPLAEDEKVNFFKGLRSFVDQNFVLKMYFEGSESLFKTIQDEFSGFHDLPVEKHENLLDEQEVNNILQTEESATHFVLLGDKRHFSVLSEELASWDVKVSLITREFEEHYRVDDISYHNIHSIDTMMSHPHNWWLYQAQ